MRPLFQELILPNLAYIGGTNEIAYWFELKRVFERHKVFFPQLMLRNSALVLGKRLLKKIHRLDLGPKDFFDKRDTLIKRYVNGREQTNHLNDEVQQALQLLEQARDHSKDYPQEIHSFVVKYSTEQINHFEKFARKLTRELKKMHEDEIRQIDSIYEVIYPHGTFQERYDNFIHFYLHYGQSFFQALFEHLDPLWKELVILEEK